MKKIIITLLTVFITLTAFGQNIVGQWNGVLKVQGMNLRLVFHISQTHSGYTATMDSPNQGVKGILVTAISFKNSILKVAVASATIKYQGILGKNNIVVGDFKQRGMSFPMNLSKGKIKLNRPQEPKKPYPYYSEDITFTNEKAQISFAGTLTLPKKNGVFPAVVLISGSGPQNRNEALFGHQPFLVLSDYLTRNGIAVLRFDDRGVADSQGNFKTATSLDFSTDVEAAVAYLKTRKEINKKKIGLIGHSEGGMIAPMVASKSDDIAFIVLLAGPGIPIDKLLLLQAQRIGEASGVSQQVLRESKAVNKKIFEMVKKSADLKQLKTDLTSYFKQALKENKSIKIPKGITEETFIEKQVHQIANPWMSYFIKYDPAIALAKVKCPVLAINGTKDLQVPSKENLEAIKKALIKGGNKNFKIKTLPNLNHLFQECKTGLLTEYESIEQTFSPIALAEILTWLQKQTK